MKKLRLLAHHYESIEEGQIDFCRLSLAMAKDLVPGFEVLNDHPAARGLDLPHAYRGNTKPKGAGELPEEFSGAFLVFAFDAMGEIYPGKSESELAEVIVGMIDPKWKGAAAQKDREKKAKTLRNRLAQARGKESRADDR